MEPKQAVLESNIDYVKMGINGKLSENISEVRIHVERAIQRIKTFHILYGEDKLCMKDIAEQIFTVLQLHGTKAACLKEYN
jgi:chloramphenicol O-acetyltransferase